MPGVFDVYYECIVWSVDECGWCVMSVSYTLLIFILEGKEVGFIKSYSAGTLWKLLR